MNKPGREKQALYDPMRCPLCSGTETENRTVATSPDRNSFEGWESSGGRMNDAVSTLNVTEPYALQMAKVARHGVSTCDPHMLER